MGQLVRATARALGSKLRVSLASYSVVRRRAGLQPRVLFMDTLWRNRRGEQTYAFDVQRWNKVRLSSECAVLRHARTRQCRHGRRACMHTQSGRASSALYSNMT